MEDKTYHYEVLIGDTQYHGKSALTYSSSTVLDEGTIVRISLRSRSVLGIVQRAVAKPNFAAKPISAIASAPPLCRELLELINWFTEYYPAPLGSIVRQFLPPSVAFPKITPQEQPEASKQTTPEQAHGLPPLTKSQIDALASIRTSGYHLLHGVTGSGKTRIYIELTKQALSRGRSAIILTPEIGLTSQLTQPFRDLFGKRVFVLHSRLTAAERRDIWYRILCAKEPVIVIGPRSAMFAPISNLGLIILDESHDQAYKSETTPRYRTERVAAKLAQLHSACFVSGSATPNIEEYYVATAKKRPVINITELAIQDKRQTSIRMIDLRDRSQLSTSTILSTPLLEGMKTALERQEQVLLFLNRRGTAAAVLCASCGWQAVCPHCDLALTYHSDSHTLRCHICNRSKSLPSACPECNHTDILFKTLGTKAIVDEVKKRFPQARLKRFDTDTHKTEQLETQLQSLKDGAVDIIIGTQMITKGLDLPRLSVVGVLSADNSLLIPDYTANERTYQLLTQVLGRASRGHRNSSTFIQTYNPEHPILVAAVEKNWDMFYSQEIEERKSYGFPPFVHLLKLSCLRSSSTAAEKAAMKLRQSLESTHPSVHIDGPAPAFHPREDGKYKWQLTIKARHRLDLLDIVESLPSGWHYDIDPINLL